MNGFKFSIILAGSLGLLALGACSSGTQTTSTTSSPVASPNTATSPTTSETTAASPAANSSEKSDGHKDGSMKGGQVIESGPYHLEFVPEKEGGTAHLDFYLLKGDNHQPVPNAKVMAEVQLPNGSQKSLEMKYDPGDKHYTVKLPGAPAGDYKIAILSTVDGQKVNARYSFKQ
jgi:hypothetical protein